MGFRVQIDTEGGCDQFENDADSFSINGSVLEVVCGDGRRVLYGPMGWLRVEVDPQIKGDSPTGERVMRHDAETQGVMRHDADGT